MAESSSRLDKILESRRVALDTMLFIYQFQKHPFYGKLTERLFAAVESGETVATASALVLAELLVLPYRKGEIRLARLLRSRILNFPNLKIMPVASDIADQAASLRAELPLRLPDCIHLASAEEADYFITNDRRFEVAKRPKIALLDTLIR